MFQVPPALRQSRRLLSLLLVAMIMPGASASESSESELAAEAVVKKFQGEFRRFESWDRQNSAPRDAVLFVGSSSIRLWPTANDFPELAVINRGFGGSQIDEVNAVADRIVLKYRPRMIVFYAGDNDIAGGKSPEAVRDDFAEFAARIHDALPETRVFYLPIKPSIARWKLWPDMNRANALVEELAAKSDHVEYVDTASPMLGPDGRPRAELFTDDGLHMAPAGYEVWNEVLRPVLEGASAAD